MESDAEFEIQLLRNQLRRAWIAASVVTGLVAVMLAWNFAQGRAAGHRAAHLEQVSAGVERLSDIAETQERRLDPLERHLASFGVLEDRVDRLGGAADRGAVTSLRAGLDAIHARLDHSDSLLTRLGEELGSARADWLGASAGSLAVLRQEVHDRLTALGREMGVQRTELQALDLRMETLVEQRRRAHRTTWVRDGLTLLSSGIILTHVMDRDRH